MERKYWEDVECECFLKVPLEVDPIYFWNQILSGCTFGEELTPKAKEFLQIGLEFYVGYLWHLNTTQLNLPISRESIAVILSTINCPFQLPVPVVTHKKESLSTQPKMEFLKDVFDPNFPEEIDVVLHSKKKTYPRLLRSRKAQRIIANQICPLFHFPYILECFLQSETNPDSAEMMNIVIVEEQMAFLLQRAAQVSALSRRKITVSDLELVMKMASIPRSSV